MSNPEDTTRIMDLDTAYGELCRLAVAAGVELPSLEELEKQKEAAELDDDKEEPEEFLLLRQAISEARLQIDADGGFSYRLVKPVARAEKIEINPLTWHYAKALRAFYANMRDKKGQNDTLGGLYAFLETLAKLPRHSLMEMTDKTDCRVAAKLANLLLGE